MYKIFFRPILFIFPAEFTHYISMFLLKFLMSIPFVKILVKNIFSIQHKSLEVEVFGIKFQNRVGLAAGFDKNASWLSELGCFGFSHIEIGTVTPEPQDGNDKPRLFRLKKDKALINRMGFNNSGAVKIAKYLKKRPKDIVIGGNIGKNKKTPNDKAVDDYLICFNILFDVVDYFVVNVSSPNTPNLRELQEKEPLLHILRSLQKENLNKKRRKPILLKIAPDLSNNQIDEIIDIVFETKIDGVIATNTTVSRKDIFGKNKNEIGGVSGLPLEEKSTEIIKYIYNRTKGKLPIVGVGGINSTKSAIKKIKAGATLIQLYTGFVYEGPSLIQNINKSIISNEIN